MVWTLVDQRKWEAAEKAKSLAAAEAALVFGFADSSLVVRCALRSGIVVVVVVVVAALRFARCTVSGRSVRGAMVSDLVRGVGMALPKWSVVSSVSFVVVQ
jgi:hypothetical protein